MVCPALRWHQCRLRAWLARPSWTLRLGFWPTASLAAPPCFDLESVQLALWRKPFFLHDDARAEQIVTKGSPYRARVAAWKCYAVIIDISRKGAASKGGRCPDGTIPLARAADNLALLWFGSIDANTIIAYGTLAKK